MGRWGGCDWPIMPISIAELRPASTDLTITIISAMPIAKLMPNYVSAATALSFAGLLNGYDTGCIGAITHMKQFAVTMGSLSATVLGITVSMIMLTGIIPSLLAGHLADKHGRLRIILPGAVLFGFGGVLQGTSFSLA